MLVYMYVYVCVCIGVCIYIYIRRCVCTFPLALPTERAWKHCHPISNKHIRHPNPGFFFFFF